MSEKTIYQQLKEEGLSRRDFMKFCGLLSGMMGLEFAPSAKAFGALAGPGPARMVAEALKSKPRLPLIWLELQDCAGCTEAISRSKSPSLVNLVLNTIAVDYQETLMAAAGFQAEQAKLDTMKKYHGQYILVVEGSPAIGDNGVYCTIGGRSNLDLLKEAAEGAAAIIATGNCASFGGLPQGPAEFDRRPRGFRDHHRQADREPPRLPGHPGSHDGSHRAFSGHGPAAQNGQPAPAPGILRPYHPRPLPETSVL